MKPVAQLWALSGAGILLQAAGFYLCVRPGWEEVNLLAGVLVLQSGTALSMWGIERYVRRIGRRDTWALAALLGPLAPLVVSRLQPGGGTAGEPGGGTAGEPARPRRTAADRVAGVLLTVLAFTLLLFGLWQWVDGPEPPRRDEPADMPHNEQLAYARLQAIAAAQQRYKEQDWDGDGQKTYAAFHIHLWQSVDKDGHPIPVGLIDRELGFAMSPRFALDGYMYKSIHHFVPTKVRPKPIEARYPGFSVLPPELEWAVAALPAVPRRTGLMSLLADSSGKIWASRNTGRLDDWVEVRDAAHLAEIQAGLEYPEPPPEEP